MQVHVMTAGGIYSGFFAEIIPYADNLWSDVVKVDANEVDSKLPFFFITLTYYRPRPLGGWGWWGQPF